jgi:predicted dehydrogenase
MKASKQSGRRQFLKRVAALSTLAIVPRYVLGGVGYTAPGDLITLGFIGAGRQAHGLKNSFLNTGEVQILAASEVYEPKTQSFVDQVSKYYAEKASQQTYSPIKVFKDFRELLGMTEVDAVVIATPDHWHGVQAIKSAEAGKDIYCEKPLSLTIKEGRAMVEAARRNDRVFQTGSMQRSWPEFRQAVELIRNGYIGEIKTIKVSVGGPPVSYNLPEESLPPGLDWQGWLGPNSPVHYNQEIAPPLGAAYWAKWRNFKEFGGGGMTDWGAHMFDIVQWALDMDHSGPVQIIPPDGNEHKFLTYIYGNGITMTHENFGWNNAVRFIGTTGEIDIQRRKLETRPDPALKDRVIGATEKRVYFSDNHYKDFLNAIRTRKNPICDVEVGHRTASVCTLGNIAYELERPLKWDPRREKFRKDKEATAMLGRDLADEWKVNI